jgi:hypothetical protein
MLYMAYYSKTNTFLFIVFDMERPSGLYMFVSCRKNCEIIIQLPNTLEKNPWQKTKKSFI